MVQLIVLYLGIGIIVWSLARIVRNSRARHQSMKQNLYELISSKATRVKPNLVKRYVREVRQYGVDSSEVHDMRQLYDHDLDFISFCDNFDLIERML